MKQFAHSLQHDDTSKRDQSGSTQFELTCSVNADHSALNELMQAGLLITCMASRAEIELVHVVWAWHRTCLHVSTMCMVGLAL